MTLSDIPEIPQIGVKNVERTRFLIMTQNGTTNENYSNEKLNISNNNISIIPGNIDVGNGRWNVYGGDKFEILVTVLRFCLPIWDSDNKNLDIHKDKKSPK